MKKAILTTLILSTILVLTVSTLSAAVYVKFEGIDGESIDAEHTNWIDVLSFEHGISVPTSSTGSSRRRGSALLEDFNITKTLDKASPKLAEKLLIGSSIPSVVVEVTKPCHSDLATEIPYYTYNFTNVMIRNYKIKGYDSGIPVEEIGFGFETIQVKYTELDAACKSKGIVSYFWDLISRMIMYP